MSLKKPLCPQRVRQVPKHFSWVDQRLVRERHIERCTHAGAALYLFLLTVGDTRGLSYYGDDSIMQRLRMASHLLHQARENLVCLGLIAWQAPLYQVLSLDGARAAESAHAMPAVTVNKSASSSVVANTQLPCAAAKAKGSTDPKLAKQVLAQLRKRLS